MSANPYIHQQKQTSLETGNPFNQKNFRSEARSELKLANKAWTDCVTKNYMS